MIIVGLSEKMVKLDDLMDMTLREVLDNYCTFFNLECGYYYGIASYDLADRMYEEFNVDEEYPEAMSVESLIDEDLLFREELIDWDKVVRIMNNLGVSKKG